MVSETNADSRGAIRHSLVGWLGKQDLWRRDLHRDVHTKSEQL